MKIQNIIVFLVSLIVVVSCSDKEQRLPPSASLETRSDFEKIDNRISLFVVDSIITSFKVDSLTDKIVNVHKIGDDETVVSIVLVMAEGIDVSSLTPVISLAPGASIKPESGVVQDFSQQVDYIVTAEDGTTVTYLVLACTYTPPTRGLENVNILVYPNNGVGGTTIPPPGQRVYDPDYKFNSKAYANTGYLFYAWFLNDVIKTMDEEFDQFIPSNNGQNVLLAAFSKLKEYNVTVQSENTNRGTVSGGGTVTAGKVIRIEATPQPGYTFDGWYDNGTRLNLSANTFITPRENCVLVAKFNMTASITGTAVFCLGSSNTFTASTIETFTWSKSSNLSLSGSGNSVLVSGTSNGSGWVSVIDNFNNKEIARYDVWIGKPPMLDLNCESGYYFSAGSYTDWYVSPPLPQGSTISWSVVGSGGASARIIGASPSQPYSIIYFNDPGYYSVFATITNVCGSTTVYKDLTVY
ncbi:MAG: InlB B-repeat-containing protein [Bacteroidales bacterium]|jgi:uncharacterized repeat protein (TIGR02543 family)|nr:InlB B-repeat-containing protein [Bacteroidales bacterium]